MSINKRPIKRSIKLFILGLIRKLEKKLIEEEVNDEDIKSRVSHMDMMAYQDDLTHVKNREWYENTQSRIDESITDGSARFGIVRIDLNNLKYINDNFGYERGNDYISGACNHICVTYDHSPVFRIDGDEFAVLLENRDYDNREELLQQLKSTFAIIQKDESREPWEKYFVAVGMAIYDKNLDKSMNDVFIRADELMYKDMMESKMTRN